MASCTKKKTVTCLFLFIFLIVGLVAAAYFYHDFLCTDSEDEKKDAYFYHDFLCTDSEDEKKDINPCDHCEAPRCKEDNANDGAQTEDLVAAYDDYCQALCAGNCTDYSCLEDVCKECEENYYNLICEKDKRQCEHCDPPVCEEYSCNDCLNKPEYFEANKEYCTHVCSGECADDRCVVNVCQKCKEGFYDLTCELPCNKSEQCYNPNTCHQLTGACTQCNDGFWGEHCENVCAGHGNCEDKFNCEQKEGFCVQCKDGFWGHHCKDMCQFSPNCESSTSCDQLTGKCKKCIDGFWGEDCSKTCVNHPNCELSGKCIQETGNCVKCKDGYWGPTCDKICDSNLDCYQNTSFCDQHTGGCLGCKEGFWGNNCSKICDHWPKCKWSSICDQKTGKHVCLECKPGYWGFDCTKECQNGPYCEDPESCERLTGLCSSCRDGFWDPHSNCEKQCTRSENCERTSVCGLWYGECNGCLDGHRGEQCSKICKWSQFCTILKSCRQKDGDCIHCVNGKWGTLCENECQTWPNCNQSHVCLRETGFCVNCLDGYWGDTCDHVCEIWPNCESSPNCVRKTGYCKKCKDGFWGAYCQYVCHTWQNCKSSPACSKDTGLCEMCEPGYWGDFCQYDCPLGTTGHYCYEKCGENCFERLCGASKKCHDCERGFYGPYCVDQCKNKEPFCDYFGNATTECAVGYFGVDCKSRCPENCFQSNCTKRGICIACQKGYFGLNCDLPCVNCPICSRLGGCISTMLALGNGLRIHLPRCNPGMTGLKCDLKCPKFCLSGYCPNGECVDCFNGYYGTNCSLKCKDGPVCNSKGENIPKCPTGTFGYNCSLNCNTHCQPFGCKRYTGVCEMCDKERLGLFCEQKCPHCRTCRRDGLCTSECYPGRYGKRCDKGCPSNCYFGKCDKNGKCIDCPEGFYSEDCSLHCKSGNSCKIESGNNEIECDPGFYGAACEKLCSPSCKNDLCTKHGTCLACKKGFFGDRCLEKCQHCAVCDRKGKCLSDCYIGYSGEYCRKPCPTFCLNKFCKKNGACRECAKGRYGDDCSLKCNTSGYCDVLGNSLKECRVGFYGKNCTTKCPKNCIGACSVVSGLCDYCGWVTYGPYCEHTCKGCVSYCSREGECFQAQRSFQPSEAMIGLVTSGAALFFVLTSISLVLFFKNANLNNEEGNE